MCAACTVCVAVSGRHTLESFMSKCRGSSPFELLLPLHVSDCKSFNLRRLCVRVHAVEPLNSGHC